MDTVFQRCIVPGCGGTVGVEDTSFVCPRCGGLLDVAYDRDRLHAAHDPARLRGKWAERANPLSFSGVWRFRELLPFADPEQVMTIGEGQTTLAASRRRRRLCRRRARPAVPAIRRNESLRQLQGQRHDGRLHARPHGRCPPGRLRLHRQHQRIAGRVLLRHRPDAGRSSSSAPARLPTASCRRPSITAP